MWKYLIINAAWFALLFAVHFGASRKTRRFLVLSALGLAFAMATRPGVDPFAWVFYIAYSAVIFMSAARFKRWVSARSALLDGDLATLTKKHESEKTRLAEKETEVAATDAKANEIASLYDRAKEMSQSQDALEVFVIFAEALAKNLRFHSAKLIIFDEPPSAKEVYELSYAIFGESFDKGQFLKDRNNAKGEIFPADQKALETLFKEQKAFHAENGHGCSVTPLFLDQKIFAALIVTGVDPPRSPLFSILVESFGLDMQRLRLYEHVETLAITDGLTGAYVRRHLMERLEGELGRSRKFGLKVSFLMIDVDHFKRFNDNYGHLVGDVVLKQVAELVKKSVREVDLVGRYGGEEFGVLLVETDEQGAFLVAERIRRSIDEKPFRAYDENLKVTISIGCSTYSKTSKNMEDSNLLVDAADSALYQAKRQGRNRVCSAAL